MALYHPELGYYAKGPAQVGRSGDFYTSVSVGPLFGRLLARRFLSWWEDAGSPERWRVIECGAHDGSLAADILGELSALSPRASAGLEYAIPEPLPALREAQREKLAAFRNVRFPEKAGCLAADPLPGIAFGNEVLDALPFHTIIRSGGAWHERLVGLPDAGENGFRWMDGGAWPGGPDGDFPEGYTTEVRTCHAAFLQPLLSSLSHGLLIWPDYGYSHADYYHPDRTTGTLRTFSRHRAAEDPLAAPGQIDITAHVDFTAVAEAATALGCRPAAFRNQGSWLTRIARPWLESMEGRPDMTLLRQFQTLTHPGHLGSRFHILELAWNDPSPARLPEDERRHLGL